MSKRVQRYCLGDDDHVCRANMTTLKSKRCPSCIKRREARKRAMKKERGATYRPYALTQHFTGEELSRRVVADIRNDWPTAIIAERYSITREDVRAINCAHYQRKARIAA